LRISQKTNFDSDKKTALGAVFISQTTEEL
jgi:hypothetical protein